MRRLLDLISGSERKNDIRAAKLDDQLRQSENPLCVVAKSFDDYRQLTPYLDASPYDCLIVFLAQMPEGDIESESATSMAGNTVILQLDEFPIHAESGNNLKMPVLVMDGNGGQDFIDLTEHILPYQNRIGRILHPAHLAKFQVGGLRNHVLKYGLMGAGSVMCNAIIARLLAEVTPAPAGQMAQWCMWQHLSICNEINNIPEHIGADQMRISNIQPGLLSVHVAETIDTLDSQHAFVLPAVPSNIHYADRLLSLHSVPRQSDIRTFQDQGGRVAVMLRHPLDILLSYATKAVGLPASDLLEKRRTELLTDPVFKDRSLWLIEAFFEELGPNSDLMSVFRYEDMLHDPENFIRTAAAFLGLEPEKTTVEELCAQIGTTDLGPPGAHHFYKPGVGKWRNNLPPDYMSDCRIRNLVTSSEKFGYSSWPASSATPENSNTKANIPGDFWHVPLFYFNLDEVQKQAEQENRVWQHENIIMVRTDKTEIEREIADNFQSYAKQSALLNVLFGCL